MKSRVTLVIEVEHDVDYDPASHFVWYFADDAPEPNTVSVSEEWEDVDA